MENEFIILAKADNRKTMINRRQIGTYFGVARIVGKRRVVAGWLALFINKRFALNEMP